MPLGTIRFNNESAIKLSRFGSPTNPSAVERIFLNILYIGESLLGEYEILFVVTCLANTIKQYLLFHLLSYNYLAYKASQVLVSLSHSSSKKPVACTLPLAANKQ